MEVKEGYVYHIKSEFFDLAKDDMLMKNHEGKATRPHYFCLKNEEDGIIWMIPMSSKVQKYKVVVESKIKKYKQCDTIVIGNYRGKDHAFLLQNMFPITEKYIDHIDTVKGRAIRVAAETRREIVSKVNKIFILKEKGINLIFPDVDRIKRVLLEENSLFAMS